MLRSQESWENLQMWNISGPVIEKYVKYAKYAQYVLKSNVTNI